jgi:hypothetical protein
MTKPEEATTPGGPEKAHGDALQDVVEAAPEVNEAESGDQAKAEPED